MTFDDLMKWALDKLPGARLVEMGNGEIAILTNLSEEVYSGTNDTWFANPPDLIPFSEVLGGEL